MLCGLSFLSFACDNLFPDHTKYETEPIAIYFILLPIFDLHLQSKFKLYFDFTINFINCYNEPMNWRRKLIERGGGLD